MRHSSQDAAHADNEHDEREHRDDHQPALNQNAVPVVSEPLSYLRPVRVPAWRRRRDHELEHARHREHHSGESGDPALTHDRTSAFVNGQIAAPGCPPPLAKHMPALAAGTGCELPAVRSSRQRVSAAGHSSRLVAKDDSREDETESEGRDAGDAAGAWEGAGPVDLGPEYGGRRSL